MRETNSWTRMWTDWIPEHHECQCRNGREAILVSVLETGRTRYGSIAGSDHRFSICWLSGFGLIFDDSISPVVKYQPPMPTWSHYGQFRVNPQRGDINMVDERVSK